MRKFLAALVGMLAAIPAFAEDQATATPIKHVVVLFQENV